MSDSKIPQDGKAMPPASDGSQLREKIAALVHDAMRFDREAKTPTWQGGSSYAESRARQAAWQIATLFQPTLTDEERERIGIVAEWAEDHLGEDDQGVVALRALLERLG